MVWRCCFALLAALFLAIGIVVRQRATMDVPDEHGVSAVMFLTLLRTTAVVGRNRGRGRRLRLPGARTGLRLAAVGPAHPGVGLLFALPLSARLAHRRVTRGEWLWAVLLTAALAVFVVLAKTSPATTRRRCR